MRYQRRRRQVRRYQGARYRGKRRPQPFLLLFCVAALLLAVGGTAVYIRGRGEPPKPPAATQQGDAIDTPEPPVQTGGRTDPEPEPPPAPVPEPAVAVENTGAFELPVEGTHGIVLVDLRVHPSDGSGAEYSWAAPAGTPFTILREGETRVLACFQDGAQGWVDKGYIMVNLPDLIPSIIYKNSNAEGSLMKNLGMDLDGITGRVLYESKVYNEKLGQEQYIMPVQYHMALKIMRAQQAAKERGLTVVLYEGFRPYETQAAVANSLQQLAGQNPDTRASIQKNGFNISYYINTGISSHQTGSAVDVSLAQVSSWEERSFHGNIVAVPGSFSEYSYGAILSGSADGVKFSSGVYYRPDLPGDTSTWMPTPMHELSYLSGSFTAPTKTYTAGAWKSALSGGSVKRAVFWTEGAQTLQDLFVGADMEPLASEWWHFNDIEARSTAKKAGATGKFEVGTQSFSRAPADAVSLAQ